MHIHILGICGSFMGGMALLARAAGHRVTGCDTNVYPPMSTQLAQQGIELCEGFGVDQLCLNPDLWVIGNVVSRGNPLMEAILDRGDRFSAGPQWLAENILQSKWVLAVSGTHGKTTTSSMLAWILEAAGKNPGFLIGGVPQNFGVSARLTDSAYFVVEADEYDTAYFDKRSKFVHYRAKTAVLTNIEFDHADIFGDIAAIETQFHYFVRTVPRSGRIIAASGDESIVRVLEKGCWTPVETFGKEGDWSWVETDAGFDVNFHRQRQGRITWDLMGAHNRNNALAAIAAAHHAGVTATQGIEALGQFRNVLRRMQHRGTEAGVAVYDDFAHHPTAIETTLEGLRKRIGSARILAVLEPRSNTMKLGAMKDRLAASLSHADKVFCYTKGLGWDAVAALAPLGARAQCHEDLSRLIAAIASETHDGDQVLVMSNGAFGGIHEKLLAALKEKN
ncbi:MAG: UDP-N-acetylmuramate:L-alanyl-gamma-D-glutamyl-meso-diaminopimelate ligase [Betaproteobacteria bacterium]|nr:UDP-N-acetylmuramate:L-alanyl-gamma-D-glutamyl-meso-diaminopimelate ligase [Betaproteobacteria bacterium]